MNNEAMKEVLNELFSHLERLETQNEAILQFLKEKKRVTDKQLAPYLEQAGNASNVKWRAARVRIDHLLEPEHLEKEAKLGKKPELHEESRRTDSSDAASAKEPSTSSSEEKRNASADKGDQQAKPMDEEENKRTGPGDQKQIEASDSKDQQAKPEAKPEDERKEAGHIAQDRDEQKSESVHHPTEETEPLAEKEGAEPAAQLSSKNKKNEEEAA